MNRCLARLAIAAVLLARALPLAGAAAQPAPPPPPGTSSAERQALAERLERETARLDRLKAQLEQIESGAGPGPAALRPPAQGAAGGASKTPATEQTGTPAAPGALSPLVTHPRLASGDVLYGLARYTEARAIYRAVARNKKARETHRIWAMLQAANCSRRLGDFGDAVVGLQAIRTAYPDSTWFKQHIEWALRAAQWQKLWHRRELVRGD